MLFQVDPQYPAVIPCRRDGYTRISQVMQRHPTLSPTANPSQFSTHSPSLTPTTSPVHKPTQEDKTPQEIVDGLFGNKKKGDGWSSWTILAACGFVLLLLCCVCCCEAWLRRTRRAELKERAERRMRMNSARGTANRTRSTSFDFLTNFRGASRNP